MDLGSAFAMSVRRYPNQVALVDGSKRLLALDISLIVAGTKYREIRAVAGGLREMGLHEGDHLVVVMRNRYEMATLYWASHMLGLVFTPVSWRASTEEIRYCLEFGGIRG